MPQMCTVREAVSRAKAEGYPVSEYALRLWIKQGAFPIRKVGNKILVFYPNLVSFLRCESGGDNSAPTEKTFGMKMGR